MSSRIVGLDIGRDMLRAVELENPTGQHPVITKYAEVRLPDGAVRSGEVREVQTVASGIKRLWAAGGFKTKRVVLGMGNQRVLARDLTVPRMSTEQIRESLPFQVQDLLPVPVADALLDFYAISEGEGENGPVIHGLLIAALKEAVMPNVTAVRLAGLETVEVDLIAFALTRLFTDRSVPETIAVIDIGATTTNVVVATNGVPGFVRIIPAGGDDITTALHDRLELPVEQAEQAKRAIGVSFAITDPAQRPAADVIIAVAGELLNSLRNTLSYFSTTHPSQPIARVVLTGGGAQLPGLSAALSEMTRMPVALGAPLGTVTAARGVLPDDAPPSGPTVALALALGSAS